MPGAGSSGSVPELSGFALLALGPELHLHPTRIAAVEGLVGLDGIGERLALREDGRRVDHTGGDEVDEVRKVFAVRRVARLHCQILLHRLADREEATLGIDADDRER